MNLNNMVDKRILEFSEYPKELMKKMMVKKLWTKIAKALNVELSSELDSQRVHRLCKKKKDPKTKPRPVIVSFASYRKRMEFMYKKSELKLYPNFKSVYLSKDLTPL